MKAVSDIDCSAHRFAPRLGISTRWSRREEAMKDRVILAAVLALALAPAVVWSQSKPVKIAVLNDQSGVYADDQGIGSVIAAQLAVEDFPNSSGMPVEVTSADHQNKV